MKIGLFDLDRTGFPNVALMKLSAWHKSQGDTVLPLNSGESADRRYGSAVFTWNRHKVAALVAQGAVVGGSGVDLGNKLPKHVEAMRPDYSLYGIDYGVGYLMRGCIWTCAFCVVPEKEGKPREVATIDDLLNQGRSRPFVVLLDNEFFWREKWAIARLQEFTERGIDFCPSQGLDVRVLTEPLVDALAASPFWNVKRSRRQITFAFDDLKLESRYRRGVEMLLSKIAAWHLQSFVLVGYNSTIEQDLQRIAIIRSYGIDPFVMVYRDYHTGKMARDPQRQNLARWVNRRLYKSHTFSMYWAEAKRAAQSNLSLEPNAEVRRIMFQRFGEERFIRESGALPIHSDEAGDLYRVEVPEDEAMVMVRVINSTPEQDGSQKPYWLRVPPDQVTAQGAVAWTFGMSAKDYQPVAES